MVEIKQIQEQTVNLLLDNKIVGKITSGLQLTDVCVQIKEQKLTGYSVQDNDKVFIIDENGRVYHDRTLYPMLGELLRKLI